MAGNCCRTSVVVLVVVCARPLAAVAPLHSEDEKPNIALTCPNSFSEVADQKSKQNKTRHDKTGQDRTRQDKRTQDKA